MKSPKRVTYSREFKLEAVRMVQAGKKTVTQISRELGVPRQVLHTWTRKAEESTGASNSDTFPGKGNRSAADAKIARLERELAQAKEDNEILKKARPSSPRNLAEVHFRARPPIATNIRL